MFDDRLRKMREQKNLNMRQTAQHLGVPYTTYVGYEKNEREPNSEILILLADFFDCSVDYLIGRKVSPKSDSKRQNTKYDVLNLDEKTHIKKYRTLDEHGKKIVNNILDIEHERCTADKKEEKYIRFVAARSKDGQSPMRTEEVSKELYEDLLNAPETDLDL